MNESYLEVCYRRGRAIAAYYSLPRSANATSHRTSELEVGYLVDFDQRGRAIGVELTDPRNVTVARMNRVLRALGQATVTRRDLEPLLAA